MDLSGFGSLDLVLEAVVEDLGVKRKVFAEIEPIVPERCILATNTSSLSVDAIAAGLRRPGRLIGLHFFNPADRMPLVEVIRGSASDSDAVAAAFAFARKIGKTPVIAGDAPGFIVNRLLMPYLAEALRALQQGVAIEKIDGDLVRFGMPMGPLALLDQIGLDVAAKVARVLADAFGGRVPPPTPLEALAKKGWLGAKSGAGFYLHGGKGRPGQARRVNAEAVAVVRAGADGSPGAAGPGSSAESVDLVARLIYPIINEAALVLDEGVARDPSTIDVAMVLGTGFPPFLGGPLRWADRTGLASIVGSLEEMAVASGPHLTPSEPLRRIASTSGRFHRD
jgi:3-hydroxyacyl-CoA dehydrogenase/enoyl-CoA hydratase/3-hydroxybutyryl-CoA epimerase